MTSVEDIQDEIERMLRKCVEGELEVIAEFMKVPEDEFQGKTNREILRKLQESFDSLPTDQKVAIFATLEEVLPLQLKAQLKNIISKVPNEESSPEDDARTGKDEKSSDSKEEIMLEMLRNFGLGALASTRNSTLHREFKIQGIVGGSKESRLDYISLCSQVNEGKRRGYKDDEIAFSLRRAVATGSELRHYLDSMPILTFQEIINCIRSAYQEKPASELFQDLNKLCQSTNEDSQAFLFRSLGLRQRVLLASEAEDQIKYDADLVQSVFLHAVRTGLRSDAIRTQMQPLLERSRRATDTELIEKMTIANAEENERCSKQRSEGVEKQKEKAAVKGVNVSGMEKVLEPLMTTISSMNEKLMSMQKEMEQLKQTQRQEPQTPSWKRRGCESCTDKGTLCDHCWKCGKSGHISRNCQVKHKTSN